MMGDDIQLAPATMPLLGNDLPPFLLKPGDDKGFAAIAQLLFRGLGHKTGESPGRNEGLGVGDQGGGQSLPTVSVGR